MREEKVKNFTKKLKTFVDKQKPPKMERGFKSTIFNRKVDSLGIANEIESITKRTYVRPKVKQVCSKCLKISEDIIRTIFNGSKEKGLLCRPCFEKNGGKNGSKSNI